ncbi:MAG: hypothetical protein PHS54_01685 [Clostridia bacterium]|nr:hypothetical protein [Clostridia bacterium]
MNLVKFLGSFINDWWNEIRIFFHEMDSLVKILIVTIVFLLALLCFIRVFKPSFMNKNKTGILPMIGAALFTAIACLIIFI